jgi:hypothetical protein
MLGSIVVRHDREPFSDASALRFFIVYCGVRRMTRGAGSLLAGGYPMPSCRQ